VGSNPAKRATNGRLAQLVRAPALHAGGQRFKSSTAHHRAWKGSLDLMFVVKYIGG
jgi:hypothetical protein